MKTKTRNNIKQLVSEVLKAKDLDCVADLIVGPLVKRDGLIWRVDIKCKEGHGIRILVGERGSDEELRENIAQQIMNDQQHIIRTLPGSRPALVRHNASDHANISYPV